MRFHLFFCFIFVLFVVNVSFAKNAFNDILRYFLASLKIVPFDDLSDDLRFCEI